MLKLNLSENVCVHTHVSPIWAKGGALRLTHEQKDAVQQLFETLTV